MYVVFGGLVARKGNARKACGCAPPSTSKCPLVVVLYLNIQRHEMNWIKTQSNIKKSYVLSYFFAEPASEPNHSIMEVEG
jgi:hypothetical protein